MKWNTKLIQNSCMSYVVYVTSLMWRFKNQSSTSTSCIDNALHLLVLVPCRVYLRTSSDVFIFCLGLHFEGLFWERYILKGQIAFEGHWRLQSWTLRSGYGANTFDGYRVNTVKAHLLRVMSHKLLTRMLATLVQLVSFIFFVSNFGLCELLAIFNFIFGLNEMKWLWIS